MCIVCSITAGISGINNNNEIHKFILLIKSIAFSMISYIYIYIILYVMYV